MRSWLTDYVNYQLSIWINAEEAINILTSTVCAEKPGDAREYIGINVAIIQDDWQQGYHTFWPLILTSSLYIHQSSIQRRDRRNTPDATQSGLHKGTIMDSWVPDYTYVGYRRWKVWYKGERCTRSSFTKEYRYAMRSGRSEESGPGVFSGPALAFCKRDVGVSWALVSDSIHFWEWKYSK